MVFQQSITVKPFYLLFLPLFKVVSHIPRSSLNFFAVYLYRREAYLATVLVGDNTPVFQS